MVHARLKYMGETKRNAADRIAVLSCPLSEETKLLKVLTLINSEYPSFRFDNLSADAEEVEYFVPVFDKEDFQVFGEVWREFKKKV